jgi:hypothetical protein
MLRTRPNSLVLTAVGLAIAAIIGVQLGRSAIAEIDPIHFQGPLERPHGITPPPEPAPYDPYRDYVWSLPPDPTLASCDGDCTAESRALSFAMDASAGRDPALPAWRDATPATDLRPWPPGETPDRGQSLERYMRYPVNREQAERAAAEPNPVATPAVAPATAPAQAQPAQPGQPAAGASEPVVQE